MAYRRGPVDSCSQGPGPLDCSDPWLPHTSQEESEVPTLPPSECRDQSLTSRRHLPLHAAPGSQRVGVHAELLTDT
jgi:hypothetical protein